MRAFFTWLAWVGVCLLLGALGGFATRAALADWYLTLAKPSWNPPAWVFGPVWTVLYLMMATAAWLVSRRVGVRHPAVALFAIHLVFNLAWSWCFFYFRSPLAGLIDIVILWCLIIATIVAFFSVSRPAAALLVPYLFWVSFAGLLNFTLWRLNR